MEMTGVTGPHAHIHKDVCSSPLHEMTGEEKGCVYSVYKEKAVWDQVHVFGICSRCMRQLSQPCTMHMLTFIPVPN